MINSAASKIFACLCLITLAGCSSKTTHAPAEESVDTSADGGQQPDLIPVIAALHDQMHSWEGTKYQWGGTQLNGVDCSGFVWRTLKDRFNIPMDRVTTRELIAMGQPVDKAHFMTTIIKFSTLRLVRV